MAVAAVAAAPGSRESVGSPPPPPKDPDREPHVSVDIKAQ